MARLPTITSAPGKLFLFGEYAVLSGGRAIVTAVDRRVFATRHLNRTHYRAHGTKGLELPRFVLEATGSTATIEHLETDVRALFEGSTKLGLGSSAASAVALCAAVLVHDEGGRFDRDDVFRAASMAHRLLQQGLGSGGDVACATYGGTLAYSMSDPRLPLSTPPIAVRPIWTGESASSTVLVRGVEEARAIRSEEVDRALTQIADVAENAVRVMEVGAWSELPELVALGDEAMERLGLVSQATIITDRHRTLRKVALRHGAVVKPSGAGGGDFSLAVGTDVDWQAFRAQLPVGCRMMELELGAEGVRVE
ncbi:MAG: mevalonate kinase [Bradymonadaceae bacterium]